MIRCRGVYIALTEARFGEAHRRDSRDPKYKYEYEYTYKYKYTL